MRTSALLLLAVAVACGPARVLTRPEGNGGWSEERRASEMAPIAERARVELDGGDAPTSSNVNAPLTLDDVVQLAAAESRRLAEADRDVDVAAARVREARGRLFPSVSSQARYSWNTDAQSNTVNVGGQTRSIEVQEKQFGTASGTLSVPIDLFGEITKGLTSAQAGYRAEQARRYATQLDEQVAAVRAYFRLLETQRLRVVDEQTLEAQRQQVKNAQSGVDAGRLTKNELLVAQVAVQSSEQQLRTRDLQIAQARWDLNQIIGRPIDAPSRVADVAARPALPSAAEALRDAYGNNPVLLALVEEQQRLEDAASALSRSRLPSFQGGGAGQWTSAEILQPQELGGGFVGMNWNFDLGGKKDAQIAQARIAADQNRIRIERQLRDVETAVRGLRQAAEERLAALATAESAVQQAEENLRIRDQQFAVGRATSEDVLDAEALLAGQRATLATALYQAHTRRAELQQVLGLPLDAILPAPR